MDAPLVGDTEQRAYAALGDVHWVLDLAHFAIDGRCEESSGS